MGGGGALRMTSAMSDDDDGGEKSYGSDTTLTMGGRKSYNCICKREYIGPYIKSEEEVP